MIHLLTSQEVLKELGLAKEVSPGVWRGNADIVTWLVQRGELPRVQEGPRTFRYELEDVQDLLDRCKAGRVVLIQKPLKRNKAA